MQRPLNDQGRQDAALMGTVCSENIPPPEILLVSMADRALQTVDIFLNHWPSAKPSIIHDEGLYLAGRDELCQCVQDHGEGETHIMICAHQPGIGKLASWLCLELTHDVPTMAVISILLEGELSGQGTGKLDFYGYPKGYR